MRRGWLLGAIALGMTAPVAASTFFPVTKTCPIGGKTFAFSELGSISRWGGLPDGMPIGSGSFPVALPVCPDNGLVMFRAFDKAAVATLKPIVASADYQAKRTTETEYYLAYLLATALGDKDAPWLLLSATWEAKNADPRGALAQRYNAEFAAAAVAAVAADAVSGDLESVALRARAVNALREIGRFEEAEALRGRIVIDPTAGGEGDEAAANRKGWGEYLASLAAPIARRDTARAPIDMVGPQGAAERCLGKELAMRWHRPEPPVLTPFEAEYCARPELAEPIAQLRKRLAE